MTSASELFYQRRSRVGRDLSLGLLDPSSSTSDHRQLYRCRHRRHDSHGCDLRTPLRRHLRPSPVHPADESASTSHDQGTNQLISNHNVLPEGSRNTSRMRSTDDRLPGTVLLARARLLERLRGMSLTETGLNARTSMAIHNREYIFHNVARNLDTEDWRTENSVGRPNGGSPYIESMFETGWVQHNQGSYKIKPPGLTPSEIDLLHSEVFSKFHNGTGSGEVSHGLFDCSICLESFSEGDELIRLPCEHRFHFTCLEPWIRTCGDCPYCRRDIVASSCRVNRTEDSS